MSFSLLVCKMLIQKNLMKGIAGLRWDLAPSDNLYNKYTIRKFMENKSCCQIFRPQFTPKGP